MRLSVLASPPPLPESIQHGPQSISSVQLLRISITDRCNLRCVYCMPAAGLRWLPQADLLSFDEIAEVVRAAVECHGIRRFKLTGGEPTLRRNLPDLIRRLRAIAGVEELSLTTNGILLESLAVPLRESGLDRVTISLDSLDPARFAAITRGGRLADVLRGMDRAQEAGLAPLKINCVVMRGVNDDEVVEFARLTLGRKLTVRFIEFMPLGDSVVSCVRSGEEGPAAGCGGQDRGQGVFVPEAQVRARIEAQLGPLIAVDRASEAGVGPSVIHRLSCGNPAGRIGFISAMSAPFCSSCNRLRLSADGRLHSCLFDGGHVDVRRIIRDRGSYGGRSSALAAAMEQCVSLKPAIHGEQGYEQMSRIGG